MTEIIPAAYRDEMETVFNNKYHSITGSASEERFDEMSSLESGGHTFILGRKSNKSHEKGHSYSQPHDISLTEIMVMRLEDGKLCGDPLYIRGRSNSEYWCEHVMSDDYGTIEAENSVYIEMGERFLSDEPVKPFRYGQKYKGFADMSNPAMVTAMMRGGAEDSDAEKALNLCRMFIRTSDSEKEAALVERRRWQTDLAVDKLHKAQEASKDKNNRPKLTIGETENMPNGFVTRVKDFFR